LVKKRRQRPLPIPPRPERRPWSREFRLQVAVIAGFVLLLAVIGGIIGLGFFQDWYEENVERPNSKALEVGETTFDLDYFARRLKLMVAEYGLQQQPEQASLVVNLLANTIGSEELLRQRAPVDLGVSVTPEEMELAIGEQLGLAQSDPEAFAAALEQELKRSDLSDDEYRGMIEAGLLGTKVQEVLSLSVPETIEQVRMRQILVGTEDEARSVLERLEAGEDFGDLARELSLDEATKEQGGERGWVDSASEEEEGERQWLTRDELNLSYAVKVFDLEVGVPSEPIPGPGGYFIFEVEEKEAEREVTDEQRASISSSYFTHWLDEQSTLVPSTEFVSSDQDKFQWAAEKAFGL
jgi:parvulin-like peptidyl-prolyl isomerase